MHTNNSEMSGSDCSPTEAMSLKKGGQVQVRAAVSGVCECWVCPPLVGILSDIRIL